MKGLDAWIIDQKINHREMGFIQLKHRYFSELGSSKNFDTIESYHNGDDIIVRWITSKREFKALLVDIKSITLNQWVEVWFFVHNDQFGFGRMSENGMVLKEFTAID